MEINHTSYKSNQLYIFYIINDKLIKTTKFYIFNGELNMSTNGKLPTNFRLISRNTKQATNIKTSLYWRQLL